MVNRFLNIFMQLYKFALSGKIPLENVNHNGLMGNRFGESTQRRLISSDLTHQWPVCSLLGQLCIWFHLTSSAEMRSDGALSYQNVTKLTPMCSFIRITFSQLNAKEENYTSWRCLFFYAMAKKKMPVYHCVDIHNCCKVCTKSNIFCSFLTRSCFFFFYPLNKNFLLVKR